MKLINNFFKKEKQHKVLVLSNIIKIMRNKIIRMVTILLYGLNKMYNYN